MIFILFLQYVTIKNNVGEKLREECLVGSGLMRSFEFYTYRFAHGGCGSQIQILHLNISISLHGQLPLPGLLAFETSEYKPEISPVLYLSPAK